MAALLSVSLFNVTTLAAVRGHLPFIVAWRRRSVGENEGRVMGT